jgi:integrase
MFNLGAQNTPRKVLTIPHIPKLKEANPRKGFFEHEEYKAVLATTADFYRGPVTFAYHTGWRQGKSFDLQWSNVDFQENTVTLDVGTTKNDEGRVVYMTEELKDLLQAQWEERKASGVLSPYVFPNESRTNRNCQRHLSSVHGARLVKRRVILVSSSTISEERLSGTWFAPASPRGWP